MDSRLAVGLGAVIGALIGYLLGQKSRGPVYADIRVWKHGGRCVSETRPFRVGLHRGQLVSYEVDDPGDCLGEGHLEFRFVDEDSPLRDQRPKDKKYSNGRRFVEQNVNFGAHKGRVYDFDIWYVSKDESYVMEDPEIQIEY